MIGARKRAIEAHCRRIFRARGALVTRAPLYPPRATVLIDVAWWRLPWVWWHGQALRRAALTEATGLVLLDLSVRAVLRGGRSHA